MRLKEDNDSYKASGVKRRQYRQSPAVDRIRRPRPSKNTKLWCKGKVGVEHDVQLEKIDGLNFTHNQGKYWRLIHWKCTNCGKTWLDSIHRTEEERKKLNKEV